MPMVHQKIDKVPFAIVSFFFSSIIVKYNLQNRLIYFRQRWVKVNLHIINPGPMASSKLLVRILKLRRRENLKK